MKRLLVLCAAALSGCALLQNVAQSREPSLSFKNASLSEVSLGGATVNLKPGDCVVQNGTRHRWINPGRRPCVMAFVLVGATHKH